MPAVHPKMKTPSWLLDSRPKKMRARAVAMVAQTFPQDMAAQITHFPRATVLTLNSNKAAATTPQNYPLEIGVLRVVVS